MASPGYMIAIPMPAAEGLDFPALRRAVYEAGELLQQAWVQLADGAVNRFTGTYVLGITKAGSLVYPYDGDGYAVAVFNRARHAHAIEEGFAAFNLAERVRWGQTATAKLSKAGTWYLRIPFRHYTAPKPGEGGSVGRTARSMPPAVQALAQRLKAGERLTFDMGRLAKGTTRAVKHEGERIGTRGLGRGGGHYLAPTADSPAHGQATAQARFIPTGVGTATRQFPGRLVSPRSHLAQIERATARKLPTPSGQRHEASIFEGMFRSGAQGHPQHMTIRTLTPDSVWMIPGRPGLHLARQVSERMDPVLARKFEAALKADIEAGLSAAFEGSPG